jgi:glucose-6-phosphate 1-dehydrogenase
MTDLECRWFEQWARWFREHVAGADQVELQDAVGFIRDLVRNHQLHQEVQMAEDPKGSRTKDPELRALHACVRELSALSDVERARVVKFITERYGTPVQPA